MPTPRLCPQRLAVSISERRLCTRLRPTPISTQSCYLLNLANPLSVLETTEPARVTFSITGQVFLLSLRADSALREDPQGSRLLVRHVYIATAFGRMGPWPPEPGSRSTSNELSQHSLPSWGDSIYLPFRLSVVPHVVPTSGHQEGPTDGNS